LKGVNKTYFDSGEHGGYSAKAFLDIDMVRPLKRTAMSIKDHCRRF
jgi:hypothetical protein